MGNSPLNNIKGYNTIFPSAKSNIEQVNSVLVLYVGVVCIFYCLCHKAFKNTVISRDHLIDVYGNKAHDTFSGILVWYQFRGFK